MPTKRFVSQRELKFLKRRLLIHVAIMIVVGAAQKMQRMAILLTWNTSKYFYFMVIFIFIFREILFLIQILARL